MLGEFLRKGSEGTLGIYGDYKVMMGVLMKAYRGITFETLMWVGSVKLEWWRIRWTLTWNMMWEIGFYRGLQGSL